MNRFEGSGVYWGNQNRGKHSGKKGRDGGARQRDGVPGRNTRKQTAGWIFTEGQPRNSRGWPCGPVNRTVCALNMLGRSERTLPPIELVRTPPVEVCATRRSVRAPGDRRIYLVGLERRFQRAQRSFDRCGNIMAIRKIASVMIHEEVHLTQGADEKSAYQAQLTMLTALGAGPTSALYRGVVLSMREALKKQKAKPPAGLLAAALP